MRHLIGVLYLLTALIGLYWSLRLTLTGLYAVPFSLWYVVVWIGAIMLLVSGVLQWASASTRTRWLPVAGSLLLASYFVPAALEMVRSYLRSEVAGGAQLGVRLLTVAFVLASLAVATSQKMARDLPRNVR